MKARAAKSTYVVFTAIFAIPFVPLFFLAGSDPGAFRISAAILVCYLFVLMWIQRFQIVLTDKELIYSSLFGGTRRICRHDIRAVRTRIRLRSKFGPPYQLLVIPVRADEKPIVINMKVFGRRDIQQLLEHLREKVEGDASLDLF